MPKIQILDDTLINKIAAGEVVEKPASVVKELIENSIDAKATKITIEVNEGGKSLIRITDNGMGMDRYDAPLSIQRHATSKLKSTLDLFGINTLGFRGEALASIASVSRILLQTKTSSSDSGLLIEVDSGILKTEKEISCPNGTIIEICDLFFNVPARKKHLKTIQTEFKYILDIITRYALAYPNIHFKLFHNNNTILNSPSTSDLLNNIATIYGSSTAKSLLPVDFVKSDIKVNGYISEPYKSRSDKSMQSIYVNGRYINNDLITKAVYEAYETRLMVNKHPIFILNISIDPMIIDVNVHPQKTVIRIEKEDALFQAVLDAVKLSLDSTINVPEVKIKETNSRLVFDKEFKITKENQSFLKEKETITQDNVEKIKLIGKIKNTYYIAENKEGMLIIDQHAAHERVMYEKFLKQFKDNNIKLQELLKPIMLETTPAESIIIENNLGLLKSLGFNIESFGKNSFLLRTTPSILGKQLDKNILFEIIPQLESKTTKIDKIKQEKIIRSACRAAVKANDVVEVTQMIDILNDLQKLDNPFTCPHGRPTMVKYTLYELEKMFKRVV